MTLVFDEREKLNGAPGLHAFIAGVSHYKHLSGGGGPRARLDFDFPQLSAAAKSAYKIYEWLLARRPHLPVPLATVRLLLSPSKTEAELRGIGSPCTRANFATEIQDWQNDAISKEHNRNYTFFYFAGHGAIRKKNDSILLLEDFGDPADGPLARAVALNDIFYGMAPPDDDEKKMAYTQLYFVDACSVLPEVMKKKQQIQIGDIFSVDLGGVDERSAPIFHASAPGAETFSVPGEQTIFNEALLACLNGAGGKALPQDEGGDVKWQVSVQTLNTALKNQVGILNQKYKAHITYTGMGYQNDAPVHTLDGPPKVEGFLQVIPPEALSFITVDVVNRRNEVLWNLPRVKPHPYPGTLPADLYTIRITIDPSKQTYKDCVIPAAVEPPSFKLYARCCHDKA
jgi:hypothetical protein